MLKYLHSLIFISLLLTNSRALAEGVIVSGLVNSQIEYFYLYNQSDNSKALKRAIRICKSRGARSCKLVEYIPSRTWISIAEDDNNFSAYYISTEYQEAYDKSIEQCNLLSEDDNCEVSTIRFSF
jgi:Domain of unknown function (DUF4189)